MRQPIVVVLGEVTDWLAIPPALRDSAVAWLATTPSAIGVLREVRQPGLIAEDLVPADEVERLCVPSYENLRGLCSRLDEALPAGAGVFSLALWELGARLDGVLWRATVLERVHERWPQARVVCWPAPEAAIPSRIFELSWSGCRWSAVLARMVWRAESGATVEPTPAHTGAAPALRGMGQWLRGNPVIWSAVQLHRQGLGTDAMARLADDSPAWLMFKAPYDWGDTLRQLASAGQRLIFDEPDRYYAMSSPGRPVSSENHQLFERLWSEFCDDLPPWTQGALEPVAEELRRLIDTAPGVMRNLYAVAARTAERFNVRGVMNAIGSDLRVQAVLAAYRAQGVPVVKWQHGSVWWNHRITQRMDDSDLSTADLHLVYGPATAKAYASAGRYGHCRLQVAGSARGNDLRRDSRGWSAPAVPLRRLLYTATGHYGDKWYCGFSPPFMDGAYFRAQAELIRGLVALIESQEGLSLTIKLAPRFARSPWPAWIMAASRSPRCRVVTNESSHAELMAGHEAVIIDCATTTLLETLCTDRFVYVLLIAPGWPEDEVVALSRRAVCAAAPEGLLGAVALHTRTGRYAADASDDTFVQRHASSRPTDRDILASLNSVRRSSIDSSPRASLLQLQSCP